MTKPKKWYLEESSGKVILKDLSGPIKKPNASNTLGGILPSKKESRLVEKMYKYVEMCVHVYVCTHI